MGRRSITARETGGELDGVLESIGQGDEIIIERGGKPVAAVISAERYEAMERSRERLFSMIDEVHERNRGVPLKVIEDEVKEAIREARAPSAS